MLEQAPRARDLMPPPPIMPGPQTPFLDLSVLAQISGAPIVDDRGGVLGFGSSRDLLRVLDQVWDDDIGSGDPASEPRPGAQALTERLRTITALDIGAPDPVWVFPATPVARVAGIQRGLLGAQGHLAGVRCAVDLLQAVES